ncbi:hypothetical protein J0K78_17000 [Halobacillus sp. GSS1]|uniref:phBC6A51 family helix-turn-helix protein n=1 Tax=Halobacillus sp. GSS1 TaxID=2815919 RepID=UPI001A8EF336|nr:phBC6A51 family helix-turn-helix protein [Halobacillus sp. GSS1]MBN9655976.1 hypothetical protein [Halobacillus sp. GSS1]
MKTIKDIEAHLDNRKIKAAHLLVANDFAPKGEVRTVEDISEEVGVSRKTIYEWKKEIIFIKYMEALSDVSLASYRSKVDSQLMKLIEGTSNNGQASVKALEMWYKLHGRLVERSEIMDESSPKATRTYSDEEMQREMDELSEMMKTKH